MSSLHEYSESRFVESERLGRRGSPPSSSRPASWSTRSWGSRGPGWIAADFDDRWDEPEHRPTVLESARACEAAPELLGLSAHILAIARKP